MPDFIILANARWNRLGEGRGGNSSPQYADAMLRRGWRVSYIQKDGANHLTPLDQLQLGPDTIAMCDMPWVEAYLDLFLDFKARGCRTVYRVVDNWLHTPRRCQYSEERERAFILAADAVFASNPLNVERFRHIRPDIALLRNGVDLDFFWNWQGPAPPDILHGDPTAVFLASFWAPDWVDWDALISAAKRRPHLSVNVLGGGPELPTPSLPRNIRLIGRKPWSELPAYLHQCDVGLVPYHPEHTRYTNPLKVLEYLACGLPVISCPNPSISDYPHVFFYQNGTELTDRLGTVTKASVPREALYETLKQHTWEARLDVILDTVYRSAADRDK